MVCPSRATHGVSITSVTRQPLPIPQLAVAVAYKSDRPNEYQSDRASERPQMGSFILTKKIS